MTNNTWTSPHYRNGCWVEAHLRSNGAQVKRHYRNGSNVVGHYMSNDSPPPHEAHYANVQPQKRHKSPTCVIEPTDNLVALAIALEHHNIARVRQKTNKKTESPKAFLNAVTYRDEADTPHRIVGIPVATSFINLPPEVNKITMDATIASPDGQKAHYCFDTPVFFNADGSISQVQDTDVDPDMANQILDRITRQTSELTVARRRNRVRQHLGLHNPERAVSQAVHEMLRLNPLPQLDLKRELSIPVPSTNYSVVLRPTTEVSS